MSPSPWSQLVADLVAEISELRVVVERLSGRVDALGVELHRAVALLSAQAAALGRIEDAIARGEASRVALRSGALATLRRVAASPWVAVIGTAIATWIAMQLGVGLPGGAP